MYDATDKVASVQVDAQHNYNQESREAVYGWFNKWLLGVGDGSSIKETPFEVPPPEQMLAFPDLKLPENAITSVQLVSNLIGYFKSQIMSLKPKDATTLEAYRDIIGTTYQYSLNVKQPEACDIKVEKVSEEQRDNYRLERIIIGQKQVGEQIPALLFVPENPKGAVLVVHPEGKSALADGDNPSALVIGLLAKGKIVLGIDTFKTGETSLLKRDESKNHFYTYNLSDTALRIQDILTGIAYLQTYTYTVDLIGLERAGIWCLLARGLANNVNRTVIDADKFDCDNDDVWVNELFIPHIRKAGDFCTSAALIAPGRLFIHNVSGTFPTEWFKNIYKVVGCPWALNIHTQKMVAEAILALF
jgi:hypothetical protein